MAGSLASLSVLPELGGGGHRDRGSRGLSALLAPAELCLPCTGVGSSKAGRQGMGTAKINALEKQSDDSPHVQCT